MLKKRFKLNTSEFKEVFNFGKTHKTSYSIIKMKENKVAYPRFAVVVSKKIAKKATERNVIKRRFFHAFEEKKAQFSKADYIFVLNSSVKDLQYKDLLSNLDSLNI